MEDPCTVWDSVSQCYIARGALESREQGPADSQVSSGWSRQAGDKWRKDIQANRSSTRDGTLGNEWEQNNRHIENNKKDKVCLRTNQEKIQPEQRNSLPTKPQKTSSTPMVTPRSVQKAIWNSNGSITVLETMPVKCEIKSEKENNSKQHCMSPQIKRNRNTSQAWQISQQASNKAISHGLRGK